MDLSSLERPVILLGAFYLLDFQLFLKVGGFFWENMRNFFRASFLGKNIRNCFSENFWGLRPKSALGSPIIYYYMPEYAWNLTCVNKVSSKCAWICLNKFQNMHKLLLSNTWMTCLKLTEYVYGSEYAWIHINRFNCARILNIPKSAEIYLNFAKHVSIGLTLWI